MILIEHGCMAVDLRVFNVIKKENLCFDQEIQSREEISVAAWRQVY